MTIPFLDLKAQYRIIRNEISDAIGSVLDSAAFAGGPFVEKFEREFAEFCGAGRCVGVGSGTDALWLALKGLGVGPGDEVITSPNTFIATAEAITLCGAVPVFVDVEEGSCNLDPSRIEEAVTPRTKAIVPVHLFGQPADMDPILEIARGRGLFVVEDACQAHGAEYKGRRTGTMGHAGAFSFYPGKNLGAYGEAGAVVTSDATLDATMRILRDHGQSRKYIHERVGWNSRMDGLQGAILSVKLRHLPAWNEARRRNAALYGEQLGGLDGVRLPEEMPYARHVYHIYPVRVRNRDAVLEALAARGIFCGIHYPVPIHLQVAYGFLGKGKGSFPVAEGAASELLSLPMYAELSPEQVAEAASGLREVLLARAS